MDTAKKTLIIVESPSKAETITRFLPKNFTVIASKGHIRDLADDRMSVDIDHGFKPEYVIPDKQKATVAALKRALAGSEQLLLATDEDREGESISWHLLQVLNPKVPYQRMVFHEITRGAILKALDNGRDLDDNLVQAQETRRIVDRLTGYTLSPLVSTKLARKKLSAGRVQSVGLRLCVDRERERIKFQSTSYADAVATLSTEKGATYQVRLVRWDGKNLATGKDFDSETGAFKDGGVLLLDEETVKEMLSELGGAEWKVTDITRKQFEAHPSIPFTTSTLQQDAIKKFHWTATRVMQVAQFLYERGFITYMRTDSPTLSAEGTRAAREAVEKLYGEDYLSPHARHFTAHTAGAQEAHEAIRPAGVTFRTPQETGLTGPYLALYNLVWKRTLASQMANARKATTTVTVKAGKGVFSASGTQIVFPGFIRAYVEGSDDPSVAMADKETFLPPIEEGEVETLRDLKPETHQTKPRGRYTEAALVKELEKRGIGRPSTYATILKTLVDRDYVVLQSGSLTPTFIGFAVTQYLERHFANFVDYNFTSEMESQLDQIAAGKEKRLDFLNAFYNGPKGLKAEIDEAKPIRGKESRKIDLPQISDDNPIWCGPYGCYVSKPAQGSEKPEIISVPDSWLPGTVTDDDVKTLLAGGKKKASTSDEAIGDGISLKSGKFGPYWQKGIKRASVPAWATDAQRRDPAFAARYLDLPRILGKNEKGEDVYATIGKYGPYVGCAGNFRNLSKTDRDAVFSVTLEQALSLLAEEKKPAPRARRTTRSKGSASARPARSGASAPARSMIQTLGEYEGQSVQLAHGRYGFYVKYGDGNYAMPYAYKKDEAKAKTFTLAQAIEVIQKKRQKD